MPLRRRRTRGEKPKAAVDMTSLIDLTFLLLVTFIVTLPALEQGITIKLPQAEADPLPEQDTKANVISVDKDGNIFLDQRQLTIDDLERTLREMVARDPNVPVWVRGDESLSYGDVMNVVKVVYKCKVTKMALVTVDKR
ncbi:MAG: biopolymer transporter ExbD [Kiritimatiellae bacterium]|jgi:biopolymer transport protein ExbD|nr:biopolymer transporter ExbD [Kiritimatiellia bacterium]